MNIVPDKAHHSWNSFLCRLDVKNELIKIEAFLKDTTFFPEEKNILKFLKLDKKDIKVIIVGMEPYPSSYEKNGKTCPVATGRSFEIANLDNWNQKFKQSSLRNILKTIYFNYRKENISLEEIRNKILTSEFDILQPKDWFNNLESQGVLFLNASLTVKPYNVKSHIKIWEPFITMLIKELDNNNIKWLLWGKDAQDRVLPLIDANNAICSCHPRLPDFIQQNCFQYIDCINWKGKKTDK